MGFTEPDSAPVAPPQMPASTWDIQAPYAAGSPQPIASAGRDYDDVSGTVDGAKAAAMARQAEMSAQTHEQGSVLGYVYTLPPSPLDPGVGSLGEALPTGAYYDPPRNYGG